MIARFNSGVSKSYTNPRHKVLPNLTRLAVNNRMLDARAPASPATLPNQVMWTLCFPWDLSNL